MSRWLHRSHKDPVSYAPPPGPPPPKFAPPPGPPPSQFAPPPGWSAAVEPSHAWGLQSDATEGEYQAAEDFCNQYPVESPRFLHSSVVDQIREQSAGAWQLEIPTSSRFQGRVRNNIGITVIETQTKCQDVCLLSTLPILAGHYTQQGQYGVYYEITVDRMDPGAVVALGSACRPYPQWRLPGWNRLSAGLHLDDMRKFFEDPDGGRDYSGSQGYLKHLQNGDTFGFGYEFGTGNIFFTRNGGRLPPAFLGAYLPSRRLEPGPDVFAAVGVSGRIEVKVNFGTEPFMWKEGNMPQWRVECHVGRLGGMSSAEDELPAYALADS